MARLSEGRSLEKELEDERFFSEAEKEEKAKKNKCRKMADQNDFTVHPT